MTILLVAILREIYICIYNVYLYIYIHIYVYIYSFIHSLIHSWEEAFPFENIKWVSSVPFVLTFSLHVFTSLKRFSSLHFQGTWVDLGAIKTFLFLKFQVLLEVWENIIEGSSNNTVCRCIYMRGLLFNFMDYNCFVMLSHGNFLPFPSPKQGDCSAVFSSSAGRSLSLPFLVGSAGQTHLIHKWHITQAWPVKASQILRPVNGSRMSIWFSGGLLNSI